MATDRVPFGPFWHHLAPFGTGFSARAPKLLDAREFGAVPADAGTNRFASNDRLQAFQVEG
jgi:hypothetical protein